MSSPSGDFRRYWLSTRTISGFGSSLIVGADEDRGDGPLHVDRLGNGEKARQLVQALAIAQPMARQRVERANLRRRSRHPRDPARDDAKLGDVGDRTVAEINLRDLHFGVVAVWSAPAERGRGLRRSPGTPEPRRCDTLSACDGDSDRRWRSSSSSWSLLNAQIRSTSAAPMDRAAMRSPIMRTSSAR